MHRQNVFGYEYREVYQAEMDFRDQSYQAARLLCQTVQALYQVARCLDLTCQIDHRYAYRVQTHLQQ